MFRNSSALALAVAIENAAAARITVETLDSMRARHRGFCAFRRRSISFEDWLAIEIEKLDEEIEFQRDEEAV